MYDIGIVLDDNVLRTPLFIVYKRVDQCRCTVCVLQQVVMRSVPYLLLLAMAVGICAGLTCPRKCKRKWCIEYVELHLQCAGNLVKDICGCCYECAKQVNESCGGMWREHGRCDVGMECNYSYHIPPDHPITHPGTCIKKRECVVYHCQSNY